MNQRYQAHMAKLVRYTASDYDESAHKAMIRLDLQDIDLPAASFDVILTPHVLEHVPNTHQAVREMYRVLSPGGSAFVMIPMPQGVTAPPDKPEYHGDNTLVYWRFGWDLRDILEAAGFQVSCLVTSSLIERVRRRDFDTGISGPDIDEVNLLEHADPAKFMSIASAQQAERYGFLPDAHFIIWQCRKPV